MKDKLSTQNNNTTTLPWDNANDKTQGKNIQQLGSAVGQISKGTGKKLESIYPATWPTSKKIKKILQFLNQR